jgi:hypothetical protein
MLNRWLCRNQVDLKIGLTFKVNIFYSFFYHRRSPFSRLSLINCPTTGAPTSIAPVPKAALPPLLAVPPPPPPPPLSSIPPPPPARGPLFPIGVTATGDHDNDINNGNDEKEQQRAVEYELVGESDSDNEKDTKRQQQPLTTMTMTAADELRAKLAELRKAKRSDRLDRFQQATKTSKRSRRDRDRGSNDRDRRRSRSSSISASDTDDDRSKSKGKDKKKAKKRKKDRKEKSHGKDKSKKSSSATFGTTSGNERVIIDLDNDISDASSDDDKGTLVKSSNTTPATAVPATTVTTSSSSAPKLTDQEKILAIEKRLVFENTRKGRARWIGGGGGSTDVSGEIFVVDHTGDTNNVLFDCLTRLDVPIYRRIWRGGTLLGVNWLNPQTLRVLLAMRAAGEPEPPSSTQGMLSVDGGIRYRRAHRYFSDKQQLLDRDKQSRRLRFGDQRHRDNEKAKEIEAAKDGKRWQDNTAEEFIRITKPKDRRGNNPSAFLHALKQNPPSLIC